MGVRDAWKESLQREGHLRDAAQEKMIGELESLQLQLEQAESSRRGLLAKLLGRSAPPVPGLYIWGGVGRGKTFLMDLFFESLAVSQKKRIHFHRMMHDVHARLAKLRDIEDPLDQVAASIAGETRVLCFDEFFVSDIGDAMLLGRLLKGLFDRGVSCRWTAAPITACGCWKKQALT